MKKYLLDTNIISEVVRKKPVPRVLDWLSSQQETSLFLSAITISEITRGAYALQESRKQVQLIKWIEKEIPSKFLGRILDFDMKCALLLGQWQGESDKNGTPFPMADGQIAAISARFGLTLVTRNIKDMHAFPIDLLNPFEL